MKKKRRHKVKPQPGQVVAIPLPNGMYGYGRIYCGAIGAYDYVSPSIEPARIVIRHGIKFHMCASVDNVESGQWPIIGEHPFRNESESWSPPTYLEDILQPGSFTLHQYGVDRPATEAEVQGIEELLVYSSQGLISRILNQICGDEAETGWQRSPSKAIKDAIAKRKREQ